MSVAHNRLDLPGLTPVLIHPVVLMQRVENRNVHDGHLVTGRDFDGVLYAIPLLA